LNIPKPRDIIVLYPSTFYMEMFSLHNEERRPIDCSLIEALNFLDELRVPYIIFGSTLPYLLQPCNIIPSDLDVIILEPDEQRRIAIEAAISNYNLTHQFHIDDKITRLGTIFYTGSDIFVASRSSTYRVTVDHLDLTDELSKIALAHALSVLIDPDHLSGPRLQQIVCTLQLQVGRVPPSINTIEVQSSPRDAIHRTAWQRKALLPHAHADLLMLAKTYNMAHPQAPITLQLVTTSDRRALWQYLKGRRIVTFRAHSASGTFVDLSLLPEFQQIHQRWVNFGRNIFLHQIKD